MLVFRGVSQAAPSSTVLTIGNFDGVHLGHRALLARLGELAAARGLPPAVLTFEPHPREFFAPESAPTRLSTLREKLELLQANGVAICFVARFNRQFAGLAADAFISQVLVERLRTRYLIIGDDFRFGARRSGDFSLLQAAGEKYGFGVAAMPTLLDGATRVSSSAVRQALWDGDLARAAELLGRPYGIAGRVVHGKKLGRQLGFATANVYIRHDRPPLLGVFAVEVSGIGDTVRQGVANLGFRPTANQTLRPLLEVHLFDFNADIYGRHIEVRFLNKLRDEMKFSGLDALQAQIGSDIAAARAFFARRAAGAS